MITDRCRIAFLSVVAPLAGLLLPVAAQAGGSASFISNSDMTADTGKPEGWDLSSYKVGNVIYKRDTAVFKSAPASLLVQTDGPAESMIHAGLQPYPKGPFEVHGFAKVQGHFERAQVVVQVFDSSWKQIGWEQLGGLDDNKPDWQEFRGKVTVPANGSVALVGISFKGNGKIWLDDVTAIAAGSSLSDSTSSNANAIPSPQPTAPENTAATLPLKIPANNSNLHYAGRFDTSDPLAPRASWPAATIKLRFRGTAANAILDGGDNRFQVVVDGKPTEVVTAQGRQTVSLAANLPLTEHTIEVVKITEAIFGVATFYGFELNQGAMMLPVSEPLHKLEIIGDSITCGYGNEAANEKEHFSNKTENAYFAYGPITARKLDADLSIVAWSGKCLAPKNTIPEIYSRALPQDANSKYDPSQWKPEAIVINLGTNDFAGGNPDEMMWITAYKQFIAKLRKQQPQAVIFCAIGPMLSDPYSPSKSALSTCRRYLQRIVNETKKAGDGRIFFLEFPMQTGSNGFGADWHPSLKQHQEMAAVLEKALSEKLGW